tara:strand:+ start:726 stop:1010 length:285 start_codon:yes stop_codon:yes gene_type:complete
MNDFDVLEERIFQLLNKLKENHLLISKLEAENQEFSQESSSLKTEISELKKDNESLRMANALLGSKESKAITKRKINSLIKEVDFCINQLSEVR